MLHNMSKLNFDSTMNSSEFIEKTEQMRSAIRATATELEEQERKMSLSFQQMADNASLNANVVVDAIKSMHKQIDDAMISLHSLDAENQARLTGLRNELDNPDNGESGESDNDSIRKEIESRENLSMDIDKQSNELTQLNAELQSYQENPQPLIDSTRVVSGRSAKSPVSDETFEGMKSGLAGVSGAFTAASSMMEMFSAESETLHKIMKKVQLAIAVTNGLQQVNNMLNKESAFQINIVGRLKLWWRNITLQAASAQGIETAAASAGTIVNLGLAGSFRAIGLAIKSIPVFGWIVAGISALIGVYSLWTSNTKEQSEKQAELNKSIKEFNENVQNNAAKPVAMIELLSIKFKALGNNINAQNKFVTDNKKLFDELGVSINTVKDAQQLLIDNKDSFIKAQIAKATSLAYVDKMNEEAKKYVEATSAADTWQRAANKKRTDEKKGKGVPNKKYKELQEIGVVSEDMTLINEYDIRAKVYSDDAQKSYLMMNHWGNMAYENLKKADDLMSGLQGNSHTTTDKNTEVVQEAHDRLMALLKQQDSERLAFVKESDEKMRQAELSAKAEGADKTLEQMRYNHEKEIEELDDERDKVLNQKIATAKAVFEAGEKLKKAKDANYVEKEFKVSTVDLTNEKKFFKDRKGFIKQKYANEKQTFLDSQQQSLNEFYKEYGNLLEKRKAIIALGESKKKGKSAREQEIIAEETKKALSDLDIEANKDKSAFGQLFSNMKDRSIKDMRAIVAEAQNMLNFVKKGKWSESEGELFHISKETFEVLKESPEEIQKIKNGIEDLNEQANASDTALNKMSIGFQHLFSAGSDPGKLNKALGEIGDSMNEVLQSAKFFSDTLAGLGDAFGSDTFSGIAEGMNVAMDAASSAMSGAQAGAMFGPWGAAAGAAIGLVSSLGSSLAKLHDAKHEKSIQRIQEQIEVLERTYDNLGDSLDKAFSTDASNLIDQQNTLLEQQKVLIGNQIAEEKSKKKTDWGRIGEWEKQIEDIDKVIAGNKEKKIDVIFGEDLKAAIENFAQAYAEAWNAGDDKAKSSKELVKNMIKQMITEAIKAASSKPMEELRKKLAGFFSDGIISDWERQQIEKDAEAIMNDLDRQFGWADEYMKGDEKESSSQDSTKGGFTSMSQETGDELNGRFTALQMSNEEIKSSMFFVMGNLSSLCTNTSNGNLLLTEMRNLAIMSNGHLEDIAKYTKVLLGFGEKLDNIAYNTKSLTVK